MDWQDVNKDSENNSNINWNQRYEYVKKNMNELNYILSKCKAKKVGKLFVSKCPFPHHNEKTGSFTVYPKDYLVNGVPQNKVTFYCFGCGCGGDVIKFHQYYNDLCNKREACLDLEKILNIDINDNDIQNELLKNGLDELLKTKNQTLDYNSINMICSKMCREYLNYVKLNYKQRLKSEFYAIQNYLKEFDEELMDMTCEQSFILISKTEQIIKMRKDNLKNEILHI